MANASVATYSGRSILWSRVKGNGTEPKNIGWGTAQSPSGTTTLITASANPDVNLFDPSTESRVAGTSTLITTTDLADTYQVTGTLTCLVANKTIAEAGLFDTTTLSPTSTVAATIGSTTLSSLTLGATTGSWPATGNFFCQCENEVVLVNGGQGTTVVTVLRGQLSSTAATHPVGAPFTLGGDGGAGSGGATSGQTATVGATNGGSIFAHADFAGIALSVNDTITFTFQDQLT